MSLPTASLYNQPEFSDVVISCGGRQVHCHRIILCSNAEYFRILCAPDSQFAESKQRVIELKEDDPDAVDLMLKYIYTKDHSTDRDDDWRAQLELYKVASKYLVHILADFAFAKFKVEVDQLREPHEVFEAITHMRDTSTDDDVIAIANELEERHFLGLVHDAEFRDWLDKTPDVMWKHLDHLADFRASLSKYYLTWCPQCRHRDLVTASVRDAAPTRCNHPRCPNPLRQPLLHTECWLPEGEVRGLRQMNEISSNLHEVKVAWCLECSRRSSHTVPGHGAQCNSRSCGGSVVFTSCWVPRYLTEGYRAAWDRGN